MTEPAVAAPMSYGFHRPHMQVAFQHSIGWDFRYIIARVKGRPVHCATVYDGVLYEAAFSGMRCLDAKLRLADGDWEVFDVPAHYDTAVGLALAVSRLRWKYDWMGAVYGWWLGRAAGKVVADKVFCSEEDADELLAIGVQLLYHRTAHYHPRSLRDELVKRHGWTSYRVHSGERVA